MVAPVVLIPDTIPVGAAHTVDGTTVALFVDEHPPVFDTVTV